MRNDQTVTIKRAGTPVYTGIPAQIDRPFQHETADYGGVVPKMIYNIFLSPPLSMAFTVYQEDLVVIQTDKYAPVIDSKTNAPRQYRIISDPAYYPSKCIQVQAEKYRGT